MLADVAMINSGDGANLLMRIGANTYVVRWVTSTAAPGHQRYIVTLGNQEYETPVQYNPEGRQYATPAPVRSTLHHPRTLAPMLGIGCMYQQCVLKSVPARPVGSQAG